MKNLWMISVIVLGFSQVSIAKTHINLPVEKPVQIKAKQVQTTNITAKPCIALVNEKSIVKSALLTKRTPADFKLSAFTSILRVNHYHFGVSISLLLLCITYFINTAILEE